MVIRFYLVSRLLALSVFLLILGACTPEPQPLHFGEAVWRAGEMSIYRVTDINGDPAGTVTFVMQPSGEDGWRLERLTQTQGDEEQLSVDMDATGYRPRASTLVRSDGEGQERVVANYNHGAVHLELTTKANTTTTEVVNIPSDSRDDRTLPMLLRTLPLAAGYSTNVNTYTPVTSNMSRVTVTVLGDEPIDTPSGSYDTWLISMDDGERQSRAWIGKEEPYPLVKYSDGANGGLFELRDFDSAE